MTSEYASLSRSIVAMVLASAVLPSRNVYCTSGSVPSMTGDSTVRLYTSRCWNDLGLLITTMSRNVLLSQVVSGSITDWYRSTFWCRILEYIATLGGVDSVTTTAVLFKLKNRDFCDR